MQEKDAQQQAIESEYDVWEEHENVMDILNGREPRERSWDE